MDKLKKAAVGLLMAATPLIAAAPAASAAPAGYGCTVDTYWEVDAYGYVTAYPAAVCGGRSSDRYTDISITATMTVDGRWVDDSHTGYTGVLRPPGTYPGIGVSARNVAGTNDFCAQIQVHWSLLGGPSAGSAYDRPCIVR